MSTLHPGMRVYVGWTKRCRPSAKSELCQTGTLKEGQLPPPPYHYWIYENYWRVQMDSGFDAAVGESIIFPIDDDDEKSVDRVKELEEVE